MRQNNCEKISSAATHAAREKTATRCELGPSNRRTAYTLKQASFSQSTESNIAFQLEKNKSIEEDEETLNLGQILVCEQEAVLRAE